MRERTCIRNYDILNTKSSKRCKVKRNLESFRQEIIAELHEYWDNLNMTNMYMVCEPSLASPDTFYMKFYNDDHTLYYNIRVSGHSHNIHLIKRHSKVDSQFYYQTCSNNIQVIEQLQKEINTIIRGVI
jgi:hypothetical protein